MRIPRTVRCCVGLLVLAPPFASSAQPDDAVRMAEATFEELLAIRVVSASRVAQDPLEAPAAVSVVTREEILHGPARNLPEVLQYVVGLDGYTKTHTDMDVAARGMAYDETAKMLVLLDGQPVNVTPYGGMQWPTLPVLLEEIARIEVVRGAASAVYGADALVGVVNIITRRAEERTRQAEVAAGEKGYRQAEGHWRGRLGRGWDLAVGGAYRRTHERSVDDRDARPDAPANWDLKDHADIWSGSWRLDHTGDGHAFTSQGGFSSSEEGYNPSPGDLAIDRSRKRTFYLNNAYGRDIGANRLNVRLGARNLWQENERLVDDRYEYKYRVRRGLGVDGDAHYVVNSLAGHTLIAGANVSWVRASRDIANDPPYLYDETETLVAGYVQDEARLLDDRLLVTASGRWDEWTGLDGQFSPKLAATWLTADRRVALRASWGTSFRRPSLDENFYYVRLPGGWIKGAAIDEVTETGEPVAGGRLEPERLEAWEVGVRWRPARDIALQVTGFDHRIEDSIGYVVLHADPGAGELNITQANVGEAIEIRGVETELKARVAERFTGFLNHAWQEGERLEGGGSTPYRAMPRHKLSAGLRYHGLVVVDVRGRYVGATRFDEVPDAPVDEYVTLDAAVSGRLAARVYAKLGVQNLLDDDHHEYPLYTRAARRATVTLVYRFR